MIVETDCQELVALWNSRATNRCAVISLLKQIQELSVNALILLNMAAHYTTKFALVSNSKCTWLHDVPDFLSLYRNEVI